MSLNETKADEKVTWEKILTYPVSNDPVPVRPEPQKATEVIVRPTRLYPTNFGLHLHTLPVWSNNLSKMFLGMDFFRRQPNWVEMGLFEHLELSIYDNEGRFDNKLSPTGGWHRIRLASILAVTKENRRKIRLDPIYIEVPRSPQASACLAKACGFFCGAVSQQPEIVGLVQDLQLGRRNTVSNKVQNAVSWYMGQGIDTLSRGIDILSKKGESHPQVLSYVLACANAMFWGLGSDGSVPALNNQQSIFRLRNFFR